MRLLNVALGRGGLSSALGFLQRESERPDAARLAEKGVELRLQTKRERLFASTMIAGFASLGLAGAAAAQASGPTSTPLSQPGSTGAPVAGATGGAVTIGQPAAVGATASDNGQPTAVQAVVVTGSRIPQPNLTSNSPMTVVNSQEEKLEGTTSVETLINNLPQFTAEEENGVSNGSLGIATANLRNIGSKRTLVLVDGRRVNPGDPALPVADLDFIPSALVDRVDVVTGGASAVYGSDAVAGVVNFIMKQNFQGVQLDVQGGFANHQQHNQMADAMLASAPYANPVPVPPDVTADGGNYELSLILGANTPDEKGNATAYFEYHNQQPVMQSSRDWSACASQTDGVSINCGGSSNSAYGRFDSTPGMGTVANNPDGTNTFVPYSGSYAYNFNPLNYIAREDNRYQAGYFAHYQVNPALEFYSEFMFMNDSTVEQIAPSGLFRDSGPNLSDGFTINCNNPFLSAQQAAALCPGAAITPGAPGGSYDTLQSIGYRFATQPRDEAFRHNDYKADVGIRGDIWDGWHYDIYGQYGESDLQQLVTGFGSLSRIQNALDVVDVNGVPTCESVVSGTDNKCVPLNIFTSLGRGLTPAAFGYVLVPALTTGETQESIISANLTGDLGKYGLKSPWADSAIGVNFGSEYRREQLSENFDEEQLTGDLSGSGGASPPANGAFDVYELFTEVRIPIANDMLFAKEVSLDLGYRFSDYSEAGVTNDYKAEGDWKPIDDIKFRGSFERATRAPNVVELFTPPVAGLSGYQDPCSSDGVTPAALSLAQCERTGVTAAEYGNGSTTDKILPCAGSQCEVQVGGNPNLKPEFADTYSVGAVFTPRFLHNFNLSVDYFHIQVNRVISAGVAEPITIIDQCANGDNTYCGLIHRDPTNGNLNSATGYVLQGETNAGYLRTTGVDIDANYRIRLADMHLPDVGSLAFSLTGTYTFDLVTEPFPGLGTYSCTGLFGTECGNPAPHWRSMMRGTWVTPWNLTLSVAWRYIGSSTLDYLSSNPLITAGPGFSDAYADEKIEPYNYFDFAFTYKLKDNYTLRGGINNIFDKDPPIIDSNGYGISAPPFGNGNTYPGVYDTLGRTIFLGVTADF